MTLSKRNAVAAENGVGDGDVDITAFKARGMGEGDPLSQMLLLMR